jgi:hypothetical protein
MSQTDTPSAEAAADSKPCVVCQEPIRAHAKKCVHCGSYQDWRSNISMSLITSVLSLLVALVTVLTAAVPVARDALTPHNSDLMFSFQGASTDPIRLIVLATNRGVRPGTVHPASSLLTMSGKLSMPLGLAEPEPSDSPPTIIEPGESRLFSFHIWAGEAPGDTDDSIYAGRCLLKIPTTDFAGKPDDHEIDVGCKRVFKLVQRVICLERNGRKYNECPTT